ncbi:hypothetical protein AAC387_Pa03g0413 [Persea americana]
MEPPHEKASILEKSKSSSSSSSNEDIIELDASKSVADTSNHGGPQLASGVDLGAGKLEKSSSSNEDFTELDASKSVADTSSHGGSQLASGVDLGAGKLEKSNSSSSSSSNEDFTELDASKSVADTSNGGSQLDSGVDLVAGKLERSNSSSSDEDFIEFDESQFVADTSNHGGSQLASGADLGDGSPFSPNAVTKTQSPPNQVIGKSDEPDPHRIPSSVFARKTSTSPMEWSMASNESLFSIHVGNSSFSKDDGFLYRSSEFSNLSSPIELFSPSPTTEESRTSNFGEGLQSPGATEAANAETMKEVLRAVADEHAQAGAEPNNADHVSVSFSQRSESTASAKSFAFPILAEGKSGSVKENPEQPLQPPPQQQLESQQQESQQQASEAAPNAAETKLFPCFSCCPFCC